MSKKYRIKKKTKKKYKKGGSITRRSKREHKEPNRYKPYDLSLTPRNKTKNKTRNNESRTISNSRSRSNAISRSNKSYVNPYENQERRRDINDPDPMVGFTKEEFLNYYGEEEGEKLWKLNKKPLNIYQVRNAEMLRNENTGINYQPSGIFYMTYNETTGKNEPVYYNSYSMDKYKHDNAILKEWLKKNKIEYPKTVRLHQEYLLRALYDYKYRNVVS